MYTGDVLVLGDGQHVGTGTAGTALAVCTLTTGTGHGFLGSPAAHLTVTSLHTVLTFCPVV